MDFSLAYVLYLSVIDSITNKSLHPNGGIFNHRYRSGISRNEQPCFKDSEQTLQSKDGDSQSLWLRDVISNNLTVDSSQKLYAKGFSFHLNFVENTLICPDSSGGACSLKAISIIFVIG